MRMLALSQATAMAYPDSPQMPSTGDLLGGEKKHRMAATAAVPNHGVSAMLL